MDENELLAKLRQLQVRAGQPSYRLLARLGGHAYAAGTTADVINGRRKSRPAWAFVHFFVSACVAHAERYGIELAPADRDLRVWWVRWVAGTAVRGGPLRGDDGYPPEGSTAMDAS
jgi:hypothetical protein